MPTPTIEQRVVLPASAARLHAAYLDPAEHARITGQEVVISPNPRSVFRAFGGGISGRTLVVVPERMIVQTWRAAHWNEADLDSVLVLVFTDVAEGGEIALTHVNVPEHDHAGVSAGWEQYYWTPWRARLAARS